MGWNDHVDFDLHERIQELLDLGHFEEGSKQYGIALLYADGGPLSPAQQWVFDNEVVPILETPISEDEEFAQALRQDWEDES